MPNTLLSDLAGVERGVLACLALLLSSARGQGSGYEEVSFVEAARNFARPLEYGLTAPGGLFAGRLPGYNLYQARDGWVAVAALEPGFWERLSRSLAVDPLTGTVEDLSVVFMTETTQFWEAWAREHDLPLVAVKNIV
jgi:crotonobetainyl-CoA:carnitine CoA-transferase CaiB-like acyl-CoA transferase